MAMLFFVYIYIFQCILIRKEKIPKSSLLKSIHKKRYGLTRIYIHVEMKQSIILRMIIKLEDEIEIIRKFCESDYLV